MVYKEFKGKKLSALGMGAMRLPVIEGDNNRIDEAATREMVAYAMEHGVNYFDTAWGYHGGNSETVMGRILSEYPRDSFYLASKFPGYDLANMDKAEEIFEKQLEKCGVDYFDFYLFHNICELNIDAYLNPQYGIMDYFVRQKEKGRIHHLGVSIHASLEVTKRFLELYGPCIEFCQIQLNYIDWKLQKAGEKVQLFREMDIPVWVMEPLRGGKLASLSEENTARLKQLRPEETVPGWAFRYLQGFDNVVVTLSGMSDFKQLAENIATFEQDKPLNEREGAVLAEIADEMMGGVPCTSCRYCTPYCPQELDIPWLLELYNEHVFTGGGFLVSMALESIPKEKHPGGCIGCRSCESVCPQQIAIADVLADFSERLMKEKEQEK